MIDAMIISLHLPTQLFHSQQAVAVTARSPAGSFGLLPNHVDIVTALVPSVLILRGADGAEAIFGIDEGMLIKRGGAVDIAVHRAVRGQDLATLTATVRARFTEADEDERVARSALARLEVDMLRSFAELTRVSS